MTIEEYNLELEWLLAKLDHVGQLAHSEEDREYKADMYRQVDRINDLISEHVKNKPRI